MKVSLPANNATLNISSSDMLFVEVFGAVGLVDGWRVDLVLQVIELV
jgi:hypothetical protein